MSRPDSLVPGSLGPIKSLGLARTRASRPSQWLGTRRRSVMGSGYFDPGAYDDHIRSKAASGASTFAYSDAQTAGSRTVHPDLDPKWVNKAGQVIRESRDGDDHPDSTPIVVVLDVTGTMSKVVGPIHSSLKNLYSLLLTKGYVKHPQIMFMAVGDS